MVVAPKILVATDCTSEASAAFHWAAFLAARLEGSLDVLHTYNSSLDRPTFQAQADAKNALRTFVGGTKVRGPSQVVRRLELGDAAQGILHVAMKEHFRFVVVGSHNQGSLHRVGLGRVARSVVQGCAAQVLVVPPDAELVGPDGAAGAFQWPKSGELPRVIVPIDFSEQSERVFSHAAHLAASLQLELIPFHALGPAGDREKVTSGLEKLLASAMSPLVRRSLIRDEDFSYWVKRGPVAKASDLVVMGAGAGYSALKRSVDEVLAAHRSPIMVVRDRLAVDAPVALIQREHGGARIKGTSSPPG